MKNKACILISHRVDITGMIHWEMHEHVRDLGRSRLLRFILDKTLPKLTADKSCSLTNMLLAYTCETEPSSQGNKGRNITQVALPRI